MPLPKNNLLFGFEPRLTDEQRVYVNSIFDNMMTFVNAPSGSGKTTLAVACARILNKPLVYIFAPVEEKKMGFRPGNQMEKEKEYLQPLKDALLEIGEIPDRVIYSEDNIENIKNGNVWVYPKSHIFARGTNIKDSVVILAESQNLTKGEMKKILTRIHDTCTVIVEGHTGQCDLDDPRKSGFSPYIEHYRNEDYVGICELTKNFRGRISRHADLLTW
ncbi:PhoH family protein [Heyndrickxia camelliae]|uniref:Phosphate starvation-inducible protein PhoH n=1 Tax=Heyndrickxia camelliae TaxID=1707093 RepID=A0A2N3LEA1_9BACI|nr:PhoH family protein [Heyndrickxia camelliae]PKR82864.1 phosphate starvation-inducible protein PhoH [Heyndrickxia camelliae]